jgi:hypothetical protein
VNRIESHSAEALERLFEVFKAKPKMRAFVTALCGPAQRIEDALYQILTERYLDTAIGIQLDTLGKIIGQPRNGLSDTDYKRYLRARVKVNRSSGLTDQLLTIARLIVNDDDAAITFVPSYPAAGTVEVTGIPFDTATAAVLVEFLRAAAADGVRLILEWSTVDPEDTFFWDTTSWDSGLIWVTSIE